VALPLSAPPMIQRPPILLGNSTSRTGASEGIEDPVAWLGRHADNAFDKCFWFLPFVKSTPPSSPKPVVLMSCQKYAGMDGEVIVREQQSDAGCALPVL